MCDLHSSYFRDPYFAPLLATSSHRDGPLNIHYALSNNMHYGPGEYQEHSHESGLAYWQMIISFPCPFYILRNKVNKCTTALTT